MDWIPKMLFQLTVLATLSEVYCVRLNPFTGFSDNYEPLTDFSINQGAYLPNMPMLSIYPKMNDDSLNSMIGLPSLNSQMLSYPNPLLPSLPQTQFSRPPSNQNKAKSNRNNNQRPPNANPQQKQRNGPQKNRAVTLDVRGGGYKLEQKQHNGPYKAPVAASSVRNVQRHNNNNNNNNNNINNNNNNNNNNRNNGRNPGRPNNMPPRNRKPNNQRPRGPNMKNPHYNMKFETSLPSMPPNVEFVSPENVLPFHPRIYKQFLQQNKQFGSLLQNMNKMNPPKSKPQQNNRNFGGPPFPGNGRNPGKQPPSKMTRNRANQMSSSLAQSSQFPSFAPNFQSPGGQLPGPEMTSQFDFLQKQNAGKLFNPPFDANFFNQDTNFFSSFGQNSGGPAGMNQFQQQPQTGSQGNLQSPQPQGPPVSNKPSNNIYQNSKPPSFGNSNPSYQGPGGPPSVESGIPSSFGNFFGGNQGMVQYDGSNMQSNTKSPENEFQQMVRYYQQLQQQQSSAPAQQYPAPPNPLGSASFGESSQSSPSVPSYPQGQQQYPNLPVQTSPYNEYQFMQGSPFQDPQTQNSGGQSLSYGKNANAPYDDSGFPGPYQASQDQVNSQLSDIQGADQAGYTMPPFSPVDPLASAIDGSHQDIQDYYGYQQAATNHNKSPVYSSEQIAQNGGSSGMHEMSPYSDDKSSQEYDAPSKSSHSKSTSEESTAGYMTPEQLFAPHSTGLQSESKFVLSSSQGDSKSSKDTFETEAAGSSVNEQHEGSERAALHLPEEVSIYVARQTENPYLFEYTEAYDPFSAEENNKLNAESDSSKQSDSFDETESDEKINQRIREFQKLLTKAPKNSYMVQPSASTSTATTPQTTTTRVPVYKKASDAESEEMKNHKTTHSYMFQYAPAEKGNTKANPVWNAWKPNASRYHLPLPETKPQITTAAAPTTTTTTTTPAPTTAAATPSYYHEPGTPACAKHNNLTYCLQDSNYPRDDIKRAIEKNRHPLDHFLVDISASSDAIDDSLNKVFENSVPLQSTSVSYSFEGKAISPDKGEANHTAGCISNVQYAKPLRAINTAGLWKIIVNVEFEETGANYTQTVRIEECSHTSGYVATCGTETISACLQQYKLYRLLAWEPNRGFYIDAFLLPISCFCGSQQS